MFRSAGFGPSEWHPLPPGPQGLVITRR